MALSELDVVGTEPGVIFGSFEGGVGRGLAPLVESRNAQASYSCIASSSEKSSSSSRPSSMVSSSSASSGSAGSFAAASRTSSLPVTTSTIRRVRNSLDSLIFSLA